METDKDKTIMVLLSTYNGEKYLADQLDSILKQKRVNVKILVRDDGSTDSTVTILENYQKKGKISYYIGPNLGPAQSFLDLLKHAENNKDVEYFALCDQDDIWDEMKCITAIEKLNTLNETNRLYTSSLNVCNREMKFLKRKNNRGYDYREAILRNESAGCTMVMNAEGLKLLNKYSPIDIYMHDWWILLVYAYTMNSGVYYDTESYINYRIHGENTVGKKRTKIDKLFFKLKQIFNGNEYSSGFSRELLKGYSNEMNSEKRCFAEKMNNYRSGIKGRIELYKQYHGYHFSSMRRRIFFIIDLILGNL